MKPHELYDAVELGIVLTLRDSSGSYQEHAYVTPAEADRLVATDPDCLEWCWLVSWHYRSSSLANSTEPVADFPRAREQEARLLVAAMEEALRPTHGGLSDKDYRDVVNKACGIHVTDDVEIDANPAVSVSDDGTWVAAWVWVPGECE